MHLSSSKGASTEGRRTIVCCQHPPVRLLNVVEDAAAGPHRDGCMEDDVQLLPEAAMHAALHAVDAVHVREGPNPSVGPCEAPCEVADVRLPAGALRWTDAAEALGLEAVWSPPPMAGRSEGVAVGPGERVAVPVGRSSEDGAAPVGRSEGGAAPVARELHRLLGDVRACGQNTAPAAGGTEVIVAATAAAGAALLPLSPPWYAPPRGTPRLYVLAADGGWDAAASAAASAQGVHFCSGDPARWLHHAPSLQWDRGVVIAPTMHTLQALVQRAAGRAALGVLLWQRHEEDMRELLCMLRGWHVKERRTTAVSSDGVTVLTAILVNDAHMLGGGSTT